MPLSPDPQRHGGGGDEEGKGEGVRIATQAPAAERQRSLAAAADGRGFRLCRARRTDRAGTDVPVAPPKVARPRQPATVGWNRASARDTAGGDVPYSPCRGFAAGG